MLPKIVTTPRNVTDRRPCVFRVCWHSRPEPRRVERAPPTSETAAPAAASEERAPAGRRAPRGLADGPMALTACHSAHPPVPSGGCVVRRMGVAPFFCPSAVANHEGEPRGPETLHPERSRQDGAWAGGGQTGTAAAAVPLFVDSFAYRRAPPATTSGQMAGARTPVRREGVVASGSSNRKGWRPPPNGGSAGAVGVAAVHDSGAPPPPHLLPAGPSCGNAHMSEAATSQLSRDCVTSVTSDQCGGTWETGLVGYVPCCMSERYPHGRGVKEEPPQAQKYEQKNRTPPRQDMRR